MPSVAFAEGSDWNDGDGVWEHPFDDPAHDRADHDGSGHSSNVENKLAAKFDVGSSQIAGLRNENLGYGEIDHTLTLAERMPGGITDENVGAVLEMRQDQGMGWGQIAHTQGTTLGKAKREFPTQPVVEPVPGDPAPMAQPKSLSRSGKSTSVASGKNGSSHGHGAKNATSRGSSNRSGKSMTSSPSAARSGGGHAYGRGGSGSSVGKANGNGNGKSKGHK